MQHFPKPIRPGVTFSVADPGAAPPLERESLM